MWQLKLIRPADSFEKGFREVWRLALSDLAKWAKDDLVKILVYGGEGVQGISDTEFFKFISSDDGRGQLGINRDDPDKLLQAYLNTFHVAFNNNMLIIKFGETAKLKMGTPHPRAGIGHLHVNSWMEFVVDQVKAQQGYVPKSDIPKESRKFISLRDATGGLMLPEGVFGSAGFWRFPTQFVNYDAKWLSANRQKIQNLIVRKMVSFLRERSK